MARQRRTQAQKFIDTLSEMNAAANGKVTANALAGRLKWNDEGRFKRVRDDLVAQGLVCASRGGGGGLLVLPEKPAAAPAAPGPVKVFVSYAHADAKLKGELIKHLDPLRRLGLVEPWHDGNISAGQDWEKAIFSHLKAADLVILLITVDFLNSDYCYDKELKAALEGPRARRPKIIPVIGRNCLWQDLPFAMGHAVHKGQAMESQPNLDEALTQAATEIRKVVEEIRAERLMAA